MAASVLIPTPGSARSDPLTPVTRLLSWIISMAAFAGALIHVAVIRHHLEYVAMTGGFAVMGAAQWWFAVRMFRRPSNRVRLFGVLLHGCILLTWALSRTVGLALVPGAEDPAPVGTADLAASLLSIAVVAALGAAWWSERRTRAPVLGGRVAHTIAAVAMVIVVSATVPAVFATHHHADRRDSTTPSVFRHGDERSGSDHDGDDHDHDHG